MDYSIQVLRYKNYRMEYLKYQGNALSRQQFEHLMNIEEYVLLRFTLCIFGPTCVCHLNYSLIRYTISAPMVFE